MKPISAPDQVSVTTKGERLSRSLLPQRFEIIRWPIFEWYLELAKCGFHTGYSHRFSKNLYRGRRTSAELSFFLTRPLRGQKVDQILVSFNCPKMAMFYNCPKMNSQTKRAMF